MKREEEQLQYYKKIAEESKLHMETLVNENKNMRDLLSKTEELVRFYRNQVLKFYEPKKD